MNWNCAQIEERLSEYLDGLLSEKERREFAAHATGCARCAPLLAQVSNVMGRMRALEPVEIPPQLIPQILEQTLGPRTRKTAGWRAWMWWPRLVLQPRFVMGAATLAITFGFVYHAMGVNVTKIKGADLNPATLFRSADRHAHLVYARGVKFVNDLRVVYEIQSRLRPEAPPVPVPVPEDRTTPPQSDPQQKSQRDALPGRTALRNAMAMAELLAE